MNIKVRALAGGRAAQGAAGGLEVNSANGSLAWFRSGAAFGVFLLLLFGAPIPDAASTIVMWSSTNSAAMEVKPFPDLTNTIAISAKGSQALALKTDGTVDIWTMTDLGLVAVFVPSGLTNIAAIAAGYSHSLAVRRDGTVVAWADNQFGQTNTPADLSNVVAVAAGLGHNLALKADGTVVAWGNNSAGETNVPPEAINVVAIAANEFGSLALRGDGTVVTWGTGTNVPSGLQEVVVIAAGYENLALKADGTVTAWSAYDPSSLLAVPTGLSNVIAVDQGQGSMALKSDGTAVSWDYSGYPYTNLPPGLTNVVAVVNGYWGGMALVGSGPPVITSPLVDRRAVQGLSAVFYIQATGQWPLAYQWRFNELEIPGATNAMLLLRDVQPGQSGLYSVVVSNAAGIVVSSNAFLAVDPLLITTPPQNTEARPGGVAQFGVNVETSVPASYQWRFRGEDLPGMTNQTLTISNVQLAQLGTYSVSISNAFGKVTSAEAQLGFTLITAWGGGLTNVPPGLTDVVAISAGYDHSLALRRNGTVTGWGDNYYGQSTIPAGLSNLVAIASGSWHNLALKADGTVIGWGDNGYGQTTIPPDLGPVAAIAAGSGKSLALKGDGTVVTWGYTGYMEPTVP